MQNLYMFCIGIFFISVFSCLFNHVHLFIGIFGLRYILLLAFVPIVLYSFRALKLNTRSFMRFVVYIGIIQLPFSILQRIFITKETASFDLITGTFTYYFSLVFIQLLSIGIVIIYWLLTGRAIIGKSAFLIIIILFVPLVMSNARAAFLFLAMLLCIIFIEYRKKILPRFYHYFISFIILIIIMYFGSIYVFWGFQKQDYGRNFKRQYSIKYILEYTFRPPLSHYQYLRLKDDPRMGRFASIKKSFDLTSHNSLTLLFGLGSGNTQESQVFNKDGKYYQRYGSLSGLNRTQLSMIISEFGILGIFLYILFFWRLWKNVKGSIKLELLEYKLISGTYIFFLVLIFIFFVYSQVLNDYLVILILSYFIAVLQKIYVQMNDENLCNF
ncbi:MAG: O-antigen ligase family protein, partial [Promethearchaeota archaeon]